MRISVIGTGYVGLVSGVCLADKGHEVTCVDVDEEKVARVNAGDPPIYEKGLEDLLGRHVGSKLKATTDLAHAVRETDLSMIAVGTPYDGSTIDLSYIKQAARDVGEALKGKEGYHVIVVKSTVVPGTTLGVVKPIVEEASGKRAGEDFGIGMNPEFLREGEAVDDFMSPDRIVLGGIDDRTLDVMAQIYAAFDGVEVVRTNTQTAEMIKYAANSLLATMISFSNEVGNLCAAAGEIDVVDVMAGVHLDKRLSPIQPDGSRVRPGLISYLAAGCGFGGSCFPKDVKALVSYGKQHGLGMDILDAVIRTNERQPEEILRLLSKHFDSVRDLRVAVLGLAFKPGTDDMRESPAIPVIHALHADGAAIKAYDPVARHEAEKLFNGMITYSDRLEDTVRDVDAVLLLTRWPEFDRVPSLLAHLEEQPLLVDGRRMVDKSAVSKYAGIGL